MNLLPMEISTYWSLAEGSRVPSGTISLGVRPEDLHLLEPGSPDSGFKIDATVAAVELVGAESYVHGVLPNQQPIVFRVPGRSRIVVDEPLTVHADFDSLHFFDASGKRLN